jgi:hypothetical protein
MRQPDDTRIDDVEKILSEAKAIEDRKQALIAELLKQREAAIKSFDEKLAKLGYEGPDKASKPKRSHHKKPAPPSGEKAKA